MPQEPLDVLGYHFFVDIEVDQAIPSVTQATIVEIAVEREKRWPVQPMQQWDEFVVLHALPPKVFANLPNGDALPPQKDSLTLRNVFIQDIHAGWDSCTYSAA